MLIESLDDLPKAFTEYQKLAEPFRERPRAVYPGPQKLSLPPIVPEPDLPPQTPPFEIPKIYEDLEKTILDVRDVTHSPPLEGSHRYTLSKEVRILHKHGWHIFGSQGLWRTTKILITAC